MALTLPLKSIPGVLFLCLFLGPLGLLYSSVFGSVVLLFFSFMIYKLPHDQAVQAFILIWLISCVWGVIGANRYNRKLIKSL